MTAPGRVILVGAGPGAVDLITVRGRAALERADAVVYDALASLELLDLAPPTAERINVGKRGHDAPTRPQEEITALLIRLARAGKTVVRLKGGDPFVFGRGGEEVTACAEAGIPFEVVPGVSSVVGALAYAGIPLTDRRHAASFAVVTGHKDPTKVSAETRWGALGTAADTVVVLMGMRNLEDIVARILAGGRSPATPAAAVMNGTLPSQRVVEATLGELVGRVREAEIGAPAVLVVGEVVSLRESLDWFERRPLFGRRVLVTRPRAQAGELAEALREAGADPVVLPLVEIAAPTDPGALDAALSRLADYDALLLTSANAAHCFAERGRGRGVDLAAAPAAFCVGPKTASAAAQEGITVARVAARRDAEGLLDELRERFRPAGRRFLMPRAEAGRETLPEGLRAHGAEVDVVAAYRTRPARLEPEALRAPLAAGELDALTFASPSAVRAFAALLDDVARDAAGRCVCAAIGPVTAEALRREGLEAAVVSERAGARELVAALVAHYSGAAGPSATGGTT